MTFVPGFMQRGESWEPVAARLAAGSYREQLPRFRSVDVRGAGRARCSPRPRRATALVGYSMGGRLALHAALRDPGRFGALVLVGVSAGIEDRASATSGAARTRRWPSGWSGARSRRSSARWERQPRLREPVAGAPRQPAPRPAEPRSRRLAQLLRSAGQGELAPVWDRLGDLRCPVLLIAGEQDRRYAQRRAAWPSESRRAACAGPGRRPRAAARAPDESRRCYAEFLDEHLGDGARRRRRRLGPGPAGTPSSPSCGRRAARARAPRRTARASPARRPAARRSAAASWSAAAMPQGPSSVLDRNVARPCGGASRERLARGPEAAARGELHVHDVAGAAADRGAHVAASAPTRRPRSGPPRAAAPPPSPRASAHGCSTSWRS